MGRRKIIESEKDAARILALEVCDECNHCVGGECEKYEKRVEEILNG